MRGRRRTILALVTAFGGPAAFTASFGATGIRSAEGCSGAGVVAEPVWTDLRVTDRFDAVTDGLHWLRGTFRGSTPDEALAQLAVEVRDAAGTVAPGTLAVVREKAWTLGTDVVVTWRSVAPLATGAYAGSYRAAGPEGKLHEGTYAFDVTDVPALAPSLPVMAVKAHATVITFGGPLATCTVPGDGYCTLEHEISVGRDEIRTPRLELSASLPRSSQPTIWELEIDGGPFPHLFLDGEPVAGFSRDLTSTDAYCFTATMRDLGRGGSKSERLCFPLLPATVVRSGDPIADCLAPPDEELRARWCAVSPHATPGACGDAAATDAGADTPDASAPEAAGADPDAGAPPTDGGTDATVDVTRRAAQASGGCVISHAPSVSSDALWLVAIALVAALRRRRP